MIDKRVDIIGHVTDLERMLKAPAVEKVKAAMERKMSADATGSIFHAQLIPSEQTVVNVERWLGLWESKKITREQFLRGIRGMVGVIKEVLGEKDLARISVKSPGTPALRTSRIFDTPFNLREALGAIGELAEA